jgi:DNA invertase Pin-like site-specific DNA recombinase
MNAKRVALYARVSTSSGQRVDLQVDALRELVARRQWRPAGEYIDRGISGTKDKRPALDRMLADAHRRRFDILAVWKLDRLARSVRHLVLLADELRALGIDLVSVEDTIDTTTPSGRFTFHVLGAVAELERELIRERTIAGLAAAKRRGVQLGRRKVAFDLERAQALRDDGASFRQIATTMGASIGKVHEVLVGRNRVRESSPTMR